MTLEERVRALSPERANIIEALINQLLLLPQDEPMGVGGDNAQKATAREAGQ